MNTGPVGFLLTDVSRMPCPVLSATLTSTSQVWVIPNSGFIMSPGRQLNTRGSLGPGRVAIWLQELASHEIWTQTKRVAHHLQTSLFSIISFSVGTCYPQRAAVSLLVSPAQKSAQSKLTQRSKWSVPSNITPPPNGSSTGHVFLLLCSAWK